MLNCSWVAVEVSAALLRAACEGLRGGCGSSRCPAHSGCPAWAPSGCCSLFGFVPPCSRGWMGSRARCPTSITSLGAYRLRPARGQLLPCTDHLSPRRVQPIRVKDPRPERADDEQQHELRFRLAPDKREEISLCPVRLNAPSLPAAVLQAARAWWDGHIPVGWVYSRSLGRFSLGHAAPLWRGVLEAREASVSAASGSPEGAAGRAVLLHWFAQAGRSALRCLL